MPLSKDDPKNIEYGKVVDSLNQAKRKRVQAHNDYGIGSPEWRNADANLREAKEFTKSEFHRIYFS